MTPREFDELLARYTKGECSPSEQAFVNQWFNGLGNDISNDEEEGALEPPTYDKEALEAGIWNNINPRPKRTHFYYFKRVAAAILMLLLAVPTVYYWLKQADAGQKSFASQGGPIENSPFKTITNHGTHSQQILLEDGSKITLEPRSEIRFAKNFDDDKRELHLIGEAFFNIKRDEQRPFFVYSNEVVTKVLGTSFNIKAFLNDKEVTVAVKTGKVSVYAKDAGDQRNLSTPNSAIILTPNQKVVYNRDNEKALKQLVEKPEIILPEPTLFKMAYDGAPVTKIFEVLEENYGVDIQYDDEILSGCVLTTTMAEEGLYERIEVICKAINAEYTITDAVIHINSRGCL